MRAKRFQIDEANRLVQRVAKQILHAPAAKLKNMQRRQVALFSLPNFGVLADFVYRTSRCIRKDFKSRRLSTMMWM